jgi:hypothetical protein
MEALVPLVRQGDIGGIRRELMTLQKNGVVNDDYEVVRHELVTYVAVCGFYHLYIDLARGFKVTPPDLLPFGSASDYLSGAVQEDTHGVGGYLCFMELIEPGFTVTSEILMMAFRLGDRSLTARLLGRHKNSGKMLDQISVVLEKIGIHGSYEEVERPHRFVLGLPPLLESTYHQLKPHFMELLASAICVLLKTADGITESQLVEFLVSLLEDERLQLDRQNLAKFLSGKLGESGVKVLIAYDYEKGRALNEIMRGYTANRSVRALAELTGAYITPSITKLHYARVQRVSELFT